MATADKTENKTKVLVNVYEPLIAIMKHKFDAACLKRDAYLDKALRIEAGFLRDEVEKPNSDRARNFIAENLKELKLKPLSLSLSTETVELMNEVCKEKNIPRDAFINRFFLLLIASDAVIEVLFFHHPDFSYLKELGREHIDEQDFFKRPNILDTVEEFVSAPPFFRVRFFCEGWGNSIPLYIFSFKKNCLNKLPNEYSFLKTNNVIGFNTFMTDDDVSEQDALDGIINANVEADKLVAFAKKENQGRKQEKSIKTGLQEK